MRTDSSNYNATVVAITEFSPVLRTIHVRPDVPVAPFESGRYVTLGLEGSTRRSGPCAEESRPADSTRMVQRAYSIASPGDRIDELEFYVAHVPTGSLTPRIWSLEAGDRIHLGKRIVGNFTLSKARTRRVLMVGTGTGIAPFVAFVRDAARHPDTKFFLLHGATRRSELGYYGELHALGGSISNFTYLPAISRPHHDPGWTGQTGRLTAYFQDDAKLLRERTGLELSPDSVDVYLCGSPGMVKDISGIIEPLGYAKWSAARPGSLHVEEYWKGN